VPGFRSSSERSVVAAVTYTTGLYAFQQMTVIPALPAFERELHASTEWTTWLLTVFLLSSCLATPILGRLGDQFGAKRVLLIVLCLFFVGCVGAAFAGNIWVLIACRAVQGLSGASVPLGLTVVRQNLPPERSGKAVAKISVIIMIATGLGAAVSGAVVAYLSWRYLFVITGAAAIGAIVWLARVVPRSPEHESKRIDVAGASLLGLGLTAVLLALTQAPSWGVTSWRTLALFAAGVAVLVQWVRVERRVTEPMVDVRMLVRRPVLVANAIQFLGLGLAGTAVFVLVPRIVTTPSQYPPDLARLATYGFGASVAVAGLYLLPLSIGAFASRGLSVRIGDRYGWKLVLALGPLICALSLIFLALFHARPWQILAALLAMGIAHPMMSGTVAKVVVEAVKAEETGVAIGMSVVIRQIGASIGAQAVAAVLSVDTIARTVVPAESAYTLAFSVGAVAALAGAGAALLARSPRRGQSVALVEPQL
jgi:MFS family permease